MNTEEKIKLIEEVIKRYKELSKGMDEVSALFGSADSNFTNSVWNTFDAYVDCVGKLIGDEFDYINWFIFENDCGKGHMECGFEGKEYKIKNIKDLVKFMELVK
jgi:hypothetical protein